MITARQAYQAAVAIKIKHQERGYGERVVFINDCPDCAGRGYQCPTCGNEPDNSTDKVLVRGRWYWKITK